MTVHLENSANNSTAFRVSVVELPSKYTVRSSDGSSSNASIGEGTRVHSPGDNRTFRAVDLPDSARHRWFTVAPGETNRTSIDDLPRRFAVVVTVYESENEIISYATANCDDQALVAFRVTRIADRLSVTHSCQ